MALCFADEPPHHIDRWRQGAESEKSTAKQLRLLLRKGWTLINDVRVRDGNIDHILIGPAAVFLIDSKQLNGVCTVRRGVLSVRWREDPTDGYENRSLAQRTGAAAAELAAQLRDKGLRHWVQPVVALWSSFDQEPVLSGRVAWIRGGDLASTLAKRPVRLSADELAVLVQALRGTTTLRNYRLVEDHEPLPADTAFAAAA